MKIRRGRIFCWEHVCTNMPACTAIFTPLYSPAQIKTIQVKIKQNKQKKKKQKQKTKNQTKTKQQNKKKSYPPTQKKTPNKTPKPPTLQKSSIYCISYMKLDFQACREVQEKPLRLKSNYLAVTWNSPHLLVQAWKNPPTLWKIQKCIFKKTTTPYRALSALTGKLLCA